MAMALASCNAEPTATATATATETETENSTTTAADSTTGADDSGGEPDDPWVERFEEEGLRASQGHAHVFRVQDCVNLDDCFGNNVSSPYILFSLPPHPDDPQSLVPSSVGEIPENPEGMSVAWRSEPGEAVVVVGRTPPPARYFGFTPYVFGRESASGNKVNIFASLGDTLNNANIAVAADGVFDAEVAIVVSSDADTSEAAGRALVAGGISAEAINHIVLPADEVRFGLDSSADDLMLLGRIALIEDADDEGAYLGGLPLRVYRLTPPEASEPLPTPPRTPRGDGTNEDAWAGALDELEDAIVTSLGDAEYEPVLVTGSGFVAAVIDPERCLSMVTECLGDNADTTYSVGPVDVANADGTLRLDDNDHFIVYGVNHTATGKATYSNMVVYEKERRAGFVAVSDAEMIGSAHAYLPEHEQRDELWAIEVRRDCGDRPHCRVLSTDTFGVPLDRDLFFIFRAYLQPGATVSPGHDELLTERILLVRGG